ncbi:hypothetical protein [Bradyrhizobium sp. 2TAF36]|uniref:hypothetical protein n=1 Tax=Bradyrhizobium sp. 2TAF36 TaxID=3233016 RepID=UPI003F91576F
MMQKNRWSAAVHMVLKMLNIRCRDVCYAFGKASGSDCFWCNLAIASTHLATDQGSLAYGGLPAEIAGKVNKNTYAVHGLPNFRVSIASRAIKRSNNLLALLSLDSMVAARPLPSKRNQPP